MKPVDDLMDSIDRSAFLLSMPQDHELWDQAERTHGHISLKARQDEYDRLLLAKYYKPPRRRGFLARLFGL